MDDFAQYIHLAHIFGVQSIEQHSNELYNAIHDNSIDAAPGTIRDVLSNEISRMAFVLYSFFPHENVDLISMYIRRVVHGFLIVEGDDSLASWVEGHLNDLLVVSFSLSRGCMIVGTLNEGRGRPYVVLSSTGELLAAANDSGEGSAPVGVPIGFL